MESLPEQTRIYYTGDMANSEDFGVITAIRPADRWGPHSYDIRLDDGREWSGVFALSFTPGAGRRFWPYEEWEADRQRRIAEMQARYAKR